MENTKVCYQFNTGRRKNPIILDKVIPFWYNYIKPERRKYPLPEESRKPKVQIIYSGRQPIRTIIAGVSSGRKGQKEEAKVSPSPEGIPRLANGLLNSDAMNQKEAKDREISAGEE